MVYLGVCRGDGNFRTGLSSPLATHFGATGLYCVRYTFYTLKDRVEIIIRSKSRVQMILADYLITRSTLASFINAIKIVFIKIKGLSVIRAIT